MQHKNIQDRINLMKYMKETKVLKLNNLMKTYVDNINNDFCNAYSAWPFRYYILDKTNKVVLIGDPINCSMVISDIKDVLDKII
jgi:hypothetical protein